MKVVVDLSICDLHGLCVEAAPEVFQIGDDGELHVLIETPPDGLRVLERAADHFGVPFSAVDIGVWPELFVIRMAGAMKIIRASGFD